MLNIFVIAIVITWCLKAIGHRVESNSKLSNQTINILLTETSQRQGYATWGTVAAAAAAGCDHAAVVVVVVDDVVVEESGNISLRPEAH